jgi:hypothetical protein
MIKFKFIPMIVGLLLVGLAVGCCKDDDTLGMFGSGGAAGGAVPLGTAGNFAILAGSTVTNTVTPTSVTGGKIGVNGPSVTNFPPGTVSVLPIETNPPDTGGVVTNAQNDLNTAFIDAAGRTTGVITVAGDLGGQTLAPGLYNSTSSLGVTGNPTLNGGGNSNSVFIIQMANSLTTAPGSQVILSGGAQAQNVYWQVGSSAVLGTNSVFEGIILCQASITLGTGASLHGRALTQTGAVSLDDNTVLVP